MHKKDMEELLKSLQQGNISLEQAIERIGMEPYLETGNGLNLDLHRGLRTGIQEVIFGSGKSIEQLITAVQNMGRNQHPVLVTRLSQEVGRELHKEFPQGSFFPDPGIFALNREIDLHQPWSGEAPVLILSAGGADWPVALEAYATLAFFQQPAGLVSDVGVAGLHRIFPHLEKINKARILIVIAGMEGALPSVLAGLSPAPVVGVPTSVGYGATQEGITPLMAMLSSCAPGISVVNIDNGFGAACFALKVLNQQ